MSYHPEAVAAALSPTLPGLRLCSAMTQTLSSLSPGHGVAAVYLASPVLESFLPAAAAFEAARVVVPAAEEALALVAESVGRDYCLAEREVDRAAEARMPSTLQPQQ
jgi:hypothetical protein